MRTVNIFVWVVRIAGPCALLFGLLIWIFQLDAVTGIHMLFGLLVALSLLVISLLAAFTSGLRVLGIIGIVYAFVLPVFGLNQIYLLVGDMHWLIEVTHMVVGIGAMVYALITGMYYQRRRRAGTQIGNSGAQKSSIEGTTY